VSEPLLRVDHLAGGYGPSQVLFGISFVVPEHGVVAVLGRTGAGKTTLLRTLLGYLKPTDGAVYLRGENITGVAPARLARRGIGYMPQERVVFPTLTVDDNLRLGLHASTKDGGRSAETAYELFPKLAERRRQQAGTLSGGERKMLGLARTLLGRPKLLVLDEPTEGVWHGVVEEILDALRHFAGQAAVLLVEQHLQLALELAETAVVLQRGEVVLQGPVNELRADANLLTHLAPTSSTA
jgi:branched-chain amino acid transport system ATP-binding protein